MSFPLLGSPKIQFFDSSGSPLTSGTLAVLDPADDTNKASYPTADDADAATNANVNPVVLDSRGEPPNGLFGIDGEDYKIIIKDSDAATVDDGCHTNVSGVTYQNTADRHRLHRRLQRLGIAGRINKDLFLVAFLFRLLLQ
ncbi:hypothetical protein LCGC14_1919320 [marine sediment metagenome]|uniref:Uncharacterized protein n=1 Tax=marine sediment metagenome TaxID=412755 RepID=A0A0F9I594_9ZZZZ